MTKAILLINGYNLLTLFTDASFRVWTFLF